MIIYKQLPGSDDKIHLNAIIPIQSPRRITAFLALKLGVIYYRFRVIADRLKKSFYHLKKLLSLLKNSQEMLLTHHLSCVPTMCLILFCK